MGRVQIGRGNKKEWVWDGPGTPFETNPKNTWAPCSSCLHLRMYAERIKQEEFCETHPCDFYPNGAPAEFQYTQAVTTEDKLKICPKFERGTPQWEKPKG